MSRPFSRIGFAATSASCTALRFAIFALWRSSSVRLTGALSGEGGGDAWRRSARVPDWTQHRAFAASLRCDERRVAAPLEHHRRRFGFGAPRDPEQPVVKIGQAMEGDWRALKDPEP